MKKIHALLFVLVLPLISIGGCIQHEVRIQPITLEPIHMTLDVNLHVDHDTTSPVTQGSESPVAPDDTAAAPAPTTL